MIRIVGLRQLPDGTYMKWCPGCDQDKRPDAFSKASSRKDGLNGHCKDCHAGKHRMRRYGMSDEEFEARKLAQRNLCPLCLSPMTKIAIDHDHATGAVRDLLCIPCNRSLGYYENEAWRDRAKAYLEKHS